MIFFEIKDERGELCWTSAGAAGWEDVVGLCRYVRAVLKQAKYRPNESPAWLKYDQGGATGLQLGDPNKLLWNELGDPRTGTAHICWHSCRTLFLWDIYWYDYGQVTAQPLSKNSCGERVFKIPQTVECCPGLCPGTSCSLPLSPCPPHDVLQTTGHILYHVAGQYQAIGRHDVCLLHLCRNLVLQNEMDKSFQNLP